MEMRNSKIKTVIVVFLVIVISSLHYFTEMTRIYYHIFFRELYFLPLILAGFWFGLRGGIFTALGISLLYVPFVVLHWQGFSPGDFDRVLEILLFGVVASGLGFLSDRRKTEEKAKVEAERYAREQAESANRLKSDFLSIMSHELKTPLISIIGYNDLLLDGVAGDVTEDQKASLKKIDKHSKKLLELIETMLVLTGIEAQAPEKREVAVSVLLEEVRAENRSLFENSRLEFFWNIPSGLPSIHTDPAKLKIILKNLLTNAVKFTEQGNVTVDVCTERDGVRFSVTDTGIGIPRDALTIIFEPFRQVESPLTRQHGGVGLGLYIARRILDLIGGTIHVQSEVGKGSRFSIWIPCGFDGRR